MITALLEERKRPEWNAEFEPDAKEEQEKVNNHYPAALSFSTTPKQEL